MLADGSLSWEVLNGEIKAGFFRPSLVREIKYGQFVPGFLKPLFNRKNEMMDKLAGYMATRSLRNERIGNKAIREYEKKSSPREP